MATSSAVGGENGFSYQPLAGRRMMLEATMRLSWTERDPVRSLVRFSRSARENSRFSGWLRKKPSHASILIEVHLEDVGCL